MRNLLCGLFFLVLCQSVAAAQDRVALVIGNSEYQFTTRLMHAANDAADIGAALTAHGYQVFGYPSTDLSYEAMETSIRDFRSAAASADIAFTWYAGHGQEFAEEDENARNWLLPVDTFWSRGRGGRGFYREERDGMLIVFSTRAGTLTHDSEGRNSTLTASFLQALAAAPKTDVRLLFSGVSASVMQATNGQQRLEIIDSIQSAEELPLVP
jgi:uncharacterized caspase-like protein